MGDIGKDDLVVFAGVSFYMRGGYTIMEERKIVAQFGDEFRAHQKRVSMIVRWKGRKVWMAGRMSLIHGVSLDSG